jgi:hypothetical protein
MKKVRKKTFVIALLCSLFLALYAGTVHAQFIPTVVQHIYQESVTPTRDGKWTSDGEWDDAATSNIVGTGGAVSGIFRDKYALIGTFGGSDFDVIDDYLIEFFTDKTNDTGDYLELCYDTTQNGGTSLVSTDLMVKIPGHNGTIQTFVGSASGWVAGSILNTNFAQAVSISKLNGTNPHWTYEIAFDKYNNGGGIDTNIMIALYDANNPAAGNQTWPPGASITNPSTWGDNDASDNLTTIPEGLGIGPMVMLSSVAVLIGFYYFRKLERPTIRLR